MFSLIRLPIEQLKLSGLRLAVAMSNQNWGMRVLLDDTALVDYLMLRSDEWKSCIDAKFNVIANLAAGIDAGVDSVTARPENAGKIQQYFREGKYFTVSHREEVFLDEDV